MSQHSFAQGTHAVVTGWDETRQGHYLDIYEQVERAGRGPTFGRLVVSEHSLTLTDVVALVHQAGLRLPAPILTQLAEDQATAQPVHHGLVERIRGLLHRDQDRGMGL